jgi:hypothetical protein
VAAGGGMAAGEAGERYMVRNKAAKVGPRVVWRMSQAHPHGEFVQVGGYGSIRKPSVLTEGSLSVSSLDLMCGADVSETDMDTLPGDLIDAFVQAMPEAGDPRTDPKQNNR